MVLFEKDNKKYKDTDPMGTILR